MRCLNCGYEPGPSRALVKVIQTSYACPSQWDAWTEDGDYIYMRFRYGYGYAKSDRDGIIAEFTYGDDMSGVISLEIFLMKTGLVLAPNVERGWE